MTSHHNPLPRELSPGLFWIGDCIEHPYRGEKLHMYNSAYLLRGERGSMMMESGLPLHLPVIEYQLGQLLNEASDLKYIWVSHQETPHAAGIGRLLTRYPDATLRGDVRDYHLFFPSLEDRFEVLEIGESIDLGDTNVTIVEPIIKDLLSTQWAFDSKRSALFSVDGFAYSHFHTKGHCGKVAEEAPDLPIPDMTGLFAEMALYWSQFTDLRPFIKRLDSMLEELGVELICPTHGLPISDPDATMPKIREGLLLGSERVGLGEVIS